MKHALNNYTFEVHTYRNYAIKLLLKYILNLHLVLGNCMF